MKRLQRGVLIVFEGIDGTGKSTQLELLRDVLCEQGYDVVVTREPTQGRYGRQIRSLYHSRATITREEELELFLLDRREHVENLLLPALSAGSVILCDRYYLSTIAYQGAAGMNTEAIAARNDFAPEPDIAFLLQLPPAASVLRITGSRGETLNDFEQESALSQVERIFNSLDFPYIQTVDASQPIEAVHQEIRRSVESYLKTIPTIS